MKQTRWSALLLMFSLLLAACGGGSSGSTPPPVPPPPPYSYTPPANNGDTWTVGDAAAAGFDISTLEDMMNDVRDGVFPNVDAVAIAKDGVLVLDETIRTATTTQDEWVGNTDPAMHAMFSVSKSITSIATGIAIDDAWIAGVDVPFLSLFSYPAYANWDVRKDGITLEDVLTMRAGLDWDEFDPPYTSPDNQWNRFLREEVDFAKAYLDLPVVADPGTVFAYSTAATVALGQALENAVPMAVIDYGISELLLPLGITRAEVTTTPTGLPNTGGGFYLLARDAAKFGELVLNGGTWNGARIVSEAWLTESMIPRTDVGWSNPDAWDWQVEGYGYQWWTGFYDVAGQQYDAYVAWGWGGQWVIAIPALDLVIAMHGSAYDGIDGETNEGHALVRNYIIPALDAAT